MWACMCACEVDNDIECIHTFTQKKVRPTCSNYNSPYLAQFGQEMEFGRFCIHILGMVTQVIMLCGMRAENTVMWDMKILCSPPQLIAVSLT